ncbi:MAG: hypothetical protein ACE5RN_05735 [Nitrosopumilaceae archaeon]
MSKVISSCDCNDVQCPISFQKKHAHVGDECFHPNNFHHKIGIKFLKKSKRIMNSDLERRYFNWGL